MFLRFVNLFWGNYWANYSKGKHQKERLNLCQVDVGKNELLAIICGAPNVSVGMKEPSVPGAKLPKITIKMRLFGG